MIFFILMRYFVIFDLLLDFGGFYDSFVEFRVILVMVRGFFGVLGLFVV